MNRREFTERWVKNLIDSIDSQLDRKSKIRLMESCGRACARGGAIREAKACGDNLDKLLSKLKQWIGKENVRKDGKRVFLDYRKCLCQLVSEGSLKLSDTYCYCSVGWLKEMFEEVIGKPVKVDLKESIKSGGEMCRFVVRL